jgi:hypothetical protein
MREHYTISSEFSKRFNPAGVYNFIHTCRPSVDAWRRPGVAVWGGRSGACARFWCVVVLANKGQRDSDEENHMSSTTTHLVVEAGAGAHDNPLPIHETLWWCSIINMVQIRPRFPLPTTTSTMRRRSYHSLVSSHFF